MTQDSVETLKFNRDCSLIISRHIKKLRNLHPRSLNLWIPKFWHQKHLYNLLPSDGEHRETYVQHDASKQTPLWNIIKKQNLIIKIAYIVMRKYNNEFDKLNKYQVLQSLFWILLVFHAKIACTRETKDWYSTCYEKGGKKTNKRIYSQQLLSII